jgi:D-alanine transaminase
MKRSQHPTPYNHRMAPTVAWLNGRLVPWGEAKVPIEDRGLQFAESLYEVLMVTAGRVRLLAEHEARMRHGAKALGIGRGVPDLRGWERVTGEILSAERLDEGLLYAQVTGGAGPRLHAPATAYEPTFFAYVRPHRFPRAADAARGVTAISLADQRWGHCDLKTTMLVPAILARREATRAGADEALLLGEDGSVREGSTSNVFIVEGGALTTPPQDAHLLPGTTSSAVATVATEAGLPIGRTTIPLTRLLRADEVFLTSTSRLVLPVVTVDGMPIGTGAAGRVALDLARRLRARLELEG